MSAEHEAGVLILAVSSIAWLVWLIMYYRGRRRIVHEQWQQWPDYHLRSRHVRENVRITNERVNP